MNPALAGLEDNLLIKMFLEGQIDCFSVLVDRHAENIYKIYAESFQDQAHLNAILAEAESIVNDALNCAKGRA